MAGILSLLLCGLAAVSLSVGAANNDDGFVWLDANTKIKLKAIGKASGNAATGGSAPERPKKKAKTKKKAGK